MKARGEYGFCQAYLYEETHSDTPQSNGPTTFYVIDFNNSRKRTGSTKIQSPDKAFISAQIKNLKIAGVNFVSRLPPHLEKLEKISYNSSDGLEVTIERKPCDLSSLLQASAGNNGNKKRAKK